MRKSKLRQNQTAMATLRRLGISPRALYRRGEQYGVLKVPPFHLKKLPGPYAVAVGETPPPYSEIEPEKLENYPLHPTDFAGDLFAELISLDEQRIVGTCQSKVYYFSEMTWFFGPEEICEGLDDEDVDCGHLASELRARRKLRFLLTEEAEADLLHLMKLGVAGRHRGKGLGLKMLKVVTDYATSSLGCGYAILQPSPIKYEAGDPGHEASAEVFAELQRRLFEYYERLDFIRPSPKSRYLFKEL